MAQDVDKAGADYHPRRVYYLARRLLRDATRWRDLQHALAAYGDIPVEPGIAGAVNDLRAVDQYVYGACCHFCGPRFFIACSFAIEVYVTPGVRIKSGS